MILALGEASSTRAAGPWALLGLGCLVVQLRLGFSFQKVFDWFDPNSFFQLSNLVFLRPSLPVYDFGMSRQYLLKIF